jgi:hypothetical protein
METNKTTSEVKSVAPDIQTSSHLVKKFSHVFGCSQNVFLLDDAATYEGQDGFRLIWTRP